MGLSLELVQGTAHDYTFQLPYTGSITVLTGTVSSSTTALTGVNTLFLTELAAGDWVYDVAAPITVVPCQVATVVTNTSATVVLAPTTAYSASSLINRRPDPWALDPDLTTLITGTASVAPTNVFEATDTLRATVWAGDNEVSLLTPTALWQSAPNGQVLVRFENADTVNLAPGPYYLQVYATRPASANPPIVARTTALLPHGTSLTVIPASGTAVPRPTYINITDVRKIAPWIDDLQVPENRAGFDDQLADARDWLDEVTLRNYRGGNVSLLGYHGFALDAWYTGGGRRTSLVNRWLKAALVANQLLVTPRIKNICAYYALSRICETFITKSGQYVALASRFRFEAESLLASTTVEIDVNGDGYGEVPINLSSTNTLWA